MAQATLNSSFLDGSYMQLPQFLCSAYLPPTGDSIPFDLTPGKSPYVPPTADSILFDFECKGSGVAVASFSAIFSDGESFDANDHSIPVLPFDEGSVGAAALTTYVIAYISDTWYDGAWLNPALATTNVLTGDGPAVAYDGSTEGWTHNGGTGSWELVIHPSAPLSSSNLVAYDGDLLANGGLQTQIRAASTIYYGDVVAFDLTTEPELYDLTVIFSAGDLLSSSLAATYNVPFIVYDGNELDATLSTFPFSDVGTTFYDGSEVDFSLATTAILTGDAPAVFYAGDEVDTVFTPTPPWLISNIFSDGAELDSSLSTQYNLVAQVTYGDIVTATLTVDPQWQPSFTFYDGTAAVLPTIAAQQSLPTLVAYEGSEFDIATVGNIENWYFYDGSVALSSLSTTVVFTDDGNAVFEDGSLLYPFALSTSPSQPLVTDSIRSFEGSTMSCAAIAHPHANFEAVIHAGLQMQVDFSTSTHSIDLAYQCIEAPDNSFYWKDPVVFWTDQQQTVQEQPGAVAHGFKTNMGVTIAFVEVLTPAPFYHGEAFLTARYFDFFESVGAMSDSSMTVALTAQVDLPLCLGNFIPDGAAVSADLSAGYDAGCEVDNAYEGSLMNCELQANDQFAATFYDGSYQYASVTTVIWEFTFWDGESMHVPSQADMTANNFHDGEFMTLSFKPITYIMNEGSTMILPSFTTDYTVDFIDIGCLENEYVDTIDVPNPFGPPPTANIELKPFVHQIKAECF